MISSCPSAYYATLCLVVCFAFAPASSLFAAESGEAGSESVESFRINLLTPNEERIVGQRLAYLYAQRHTMLPDDATQNRLNSVAARLSRITDTGSLNIIVIKSARPEAVSFPPATIFITSALLAMTPTDDELAAVIAHESAHLSRRHLARLIGLSLTLSPTEREAFPSRTAIITGRVSQFVFPAALDRDCLRYEMEADRLACLWLEQAGYRVNALATLLRHLFDRLSPQAQRDRACLRERLALLAPAEARPPAWHEQHDDPPAAFWIR